MSKVSGIDTDKVCFAAWSVFEKIIAAIQSDLLQHYSCIFSASRTVSIELWLAQFRDGLV
jgi:hypothetical protein